MKSGIYKITNTSNGKVYIGQTSDYSRRICNHKTNLKCNRHGNLHLQRAYNQDKDYFTFEFIFECSIADLNDFECHFIKQYNSKNPNFGYNFTDGGEGTVGFKMPLHAIIAANNKKRGQKHPEHSKKMMGMGNPNYGKKWSVEKKQKLSEKLKGRKPWNTGKTNLPPTWNKGMKMPFKARGKYKSKVAA